MTRAYLHQGWDERNVKSLRILILVATCGPHVQCATTIGELAGRALPGVARAKRDVVVFPTMGGIIHRVNVTEGQWVHRGDILLTLDDRVASASVALARAAADQAAQIEFAQAELTMATKHLERLQDMSDARAVSQHERDQAIANRAKAAANLKTAYRERELALAKLKVEEARLETHNIRAPFDGFVVKLKCSTGQRVFEDSELMRLMNREELTVDLHLPSALFGKMNLGDFYELEADRPINAVLRCRLLSIEPIIDPGTQSFRCQFDYDNSPRNLPTGFIIRMPKHAATALESPLTRNRPTGLPAVNPAFNH